MRQDQLRKHLCGALEKALAGQPPEPSEAGRFLWRTFLELSATRTYSAAGPNPLQPGEIAAWCQLRAVALTPDHVETLFAMDRVWMDTSTAKPAGPSDVPTLPRVSQQPLTAALLDAVMG